MSGIEKAMLVGDVVFFGTLLSLLMGVWLAMLVMFGWVIFAARQEEDSA